MLIYAPGAASVISLKPLSAAHSKTPQSARQGQMHFKNPTHDIHMTIGW